MDFDLHKLGWYGFQQLSQAITREIFGQTAQAFLASRDGGRDGAFTGTWSGVGESLSGRFVVQCKHSTLAGSNLALSDLSDEFEKAGRLHSRGLCDVYIVMTNQGISGPLDEEINSELNRRGILQVRTYGRDWINQTLTEAKRLRMLVPRVYGLGDLTQILDERAYRQATAVLEGMRDDLAKVVRTRTYEKAARALDAHNFVLLLGEPAAGKSTIAAQLALAAIDVHDSSVIKLDAVGDFANRWNVDEPQLFWVDDAFGATQFEVQLAHEWARLVPKIHAAIGRGSRIIVTSRDYIYQAARPHLKMGSFPLLNESQVTVDVHKLTRSEKRQILYNHLKHGTQSEEFLKSVLPYLDTVVDHWGFSPELARRLAHPLFTKRLKLPSSEEVTDFFARPIEFLSQTLRELDTDMQAALGLIYSHQGHLPSPTTYDENDIDLLQRLGSSVGGVTAALDNMNGSLIRLARRSSSSGWQYAHPTMAEAYENMLRWHPELLHHYVRQAALAGLLRTITCGDVGIQGALVVGPNLYDLVMVRLDGRLADVPVGAPSLVNRKVDVRVRGMTDYFLYSRCDRDFLAKYLEGHPEFLSRIVKPGLMLDAVVEVRLVKRMYSLGLMPEDARAAFVERISRYLLDGEDASVLSDDELRAMVTEAEMEELHQCIKEELVPSLDDIVAGVIGDYEADYGSPREYVTYIRGLLSVLAEEFPTDDELRALCEEQDQVLDGFVENTSWHDYDGSEGWHDDEGRSSVGDAPGRSIFDDLVS